MVADFYDSSAFAKLFRNEIGTPYVRARYANADLRVLSRLALTEVFSAIARTKRGGFLTQATADAARSAVRFEAQQCTVLPINEDIHAAAELLLEQQALRTLDALQLASALVANRLQPTYFVAADRRLLQVAQSSGLTVIDANRQP